MLAMHSSSIYANIQQAKANGRKMLAALIDPDKTTQDGLSDLGVKAEELGIDYFFLGGSLITENKLDDCLRAIRENCRIPVLLFPGSILQINPNANGILLLSLLSGRNPELLIGQHVVAAPYLRESGLEIIPTAYLLIDGGRPTTANYMSNTLPIPADKPDIAACTAMAGQMLGFKLIYLDAGSGAENQVNTATIKAVRKAVDLPIIIGGGIRTPDAAQRSLEAGADLIVVGNALEKRPALLEGFARVFE